MPAQGDAGHVEPWSAPILIVAAAACVVAAVLVAADVDSPLRVAAVLLLFTLAPGAAVLGRRHGHPGLVIATSLALDALGAQVLLWLGGWEPVAATYVLAALCFPVLVLRLVRRPAPAEAARERRRVRARLGGADRARRAGRRRGGARGSVRGAVSPGASARPGARDAARVRDAPAGGRRAARRRRSSGHVRAQVGGALAAHLRADGLPPAELEPGGIPPADRPPCTAPGPYPERAAGLTSVIVCTRDRPDRLVTAVRSVLDSDRGDLEVVVVDNAPATAPARAAVEGLGDPRVRYVLEPRPGLSRARNTGAAQASGVFLAFTDDDVRVDRSWLSRLLNGFTRDAHVGCATGVVLAAELETPAQAYIEERLDWSAFGEPQLFDMAAHRSDDPMYPFSAGRFGTGANFAVDRDTWTALGGLDPLLGTGTPAMGGEDLDFFLRVVLAGRALAAEPSAIVWHWHHRTMDAAAPPAAGLRGGHGRLRVQAPARPAHRSGDRAARAERAAADAARHPQREHGDHR